MSFLFNLIFSSFLMFVFITGYQYYKVQVQDDVVYDCFTQIVGKARKTNAKKPEIQEELEEWAKKLERLNQGLPEEAADGEQSETIIVGDNVTAEVEQVVEVPTEVKTKAPTKRSRRKKKVEESSEEESSEEDSEEDVDELDLSSDSD